MPYTSPYGTGDRRAVITVTNTIYFYIYTNINTLVNGNTTEEQLWTSQTNEGRYIRFLFPEAIMVDHVKWLQGGTSTHGTFKIQASNNGADWDDIGAEFTLGGSTSQEIDISTNVTPYTYYQLLGVLGDMSPSDWIFEVEFSWTKEVGPSNIKSVNGVAYASINSIDGIAIASISLVNGV